MISFGTTEQYVSEYGRGGPKSERFKMEGRVGLMATENAILGGGYASTCTGLPADYGKDTGQYPHFLYRIGKSVALDFTCKYSLSTLAVKMSSTATLKGGVLTLNANADYVRPDGKYKGHAEEEAEFELSGGKCVIRKYRRFETYSEQSRYTICHEEIDSAKANETCYRRDEGRAN